MRPFELELGAQLQAPDVTRFRVWAPKANTVAVRVCKDGRSIPMQKVAHGFYESVVSGAQAGTDYLYVLDGQRERPDPASRYQPEGVHGPSRIVDPSGFSWTDGSFRGVELSELIIYELHIGTFTPGGTFDAAISKFDYLKELGVTALEIMPIAEFPGARNWGYDGVALYAPHSTYGGPEGLKRFIDGAHQKGLAVILDVVYNHLGPEGNYLGEYAPYFTERYRTPWGPALNFDDTDCEPVRRFFIDNALYWLTEFHVDGLRLDAVHAIYDFSAEHVLSELSREFHDQADRLGRRAWLIAESDLNDVRVLRQREQGGYGIDAQWSDDFHHALHSVTTGCRHGYFADFGTLGDLCKAIENGFVYDGRYSEFRRRRHGNSSAAVSGQHFVICNQNHDQIANASGGTRISRLLSPAEQRVSSALLLCAPYLVMLFQGQEYGELAPFRYFTSHCDPELSRAVQEGRKAEYLAFSKELEFVDPQSEQAFYESKLDWDRPLRAPHAGLKALFGELLRLRKSLPALANCRKDLTSCRFDESEQWLIVERADPSGAAALLVASLSDEPRRVRLTASARRYRLVLWTDEARFGAETTGALGVPVELEGSAVLMLAPWTAALYATDEN